MLGEVWKLEFEGVIGVGLEVWVEEVESWD